MSRNQHAYVLLAVLGVVSCGGSQTPGKSAASPDGEHAEGALGADSSGSDTSRGEPKVESYCDDGTCAVCGEGICPTGYYCDESGEPACSWLPGCGQNPDCGCITRRLGSGCTCEEREGGLFVQCP